MSQVKMLYDYFLKNVNGNSKYSQKKIYWAYRHTDRWLNELQPARLAFDKYQCRMCDAKATCVHHRIYPKILGTETIDDLTSLCHKCHHNYHFPPSIQEIKKQGVTGRCPLCEQLVKKLNPHSMCAGKVGILKHMAHLAGLGYQWIKPTASGLFLTTSDGKKHDTPKESRVNLQRLAYFKLVDHQVGRKVGGYRINDDGKAFLEDKLAVPSIIFCRNGEVITVSTETVTVSKVKNVYLGSTHWEIYSALQKHTNEAPGVKQEPSND